MINGQEFFFSNKFILFSEIMNAKFYVNILRRELPEIEDLLGNDWRFQQTMIRNIPATLLRTLFVIICPKLLTGLLTVLI
jgi:hypothetical protein